MKHTIDAKGKPLGRVASEAARLLIGKDSVSFQRNIAPKVEVNVINAAQISISEKKRENKEHKIYSGYPGGLRSEKLKDSLLKKGYGEVIRKTVSGMLPKNKLRAIMIKNLKVND
jgi:large subunit ribosomal protein L13